jgi:AhpD family alkylhydroperoxidase
MEAVFNTGTLHKALKELVIVRTSQLNRTPYCLASHTTIAHKLGWTEGQIEVLQGIQRTGEGSDPSR